MNEEEEHLEFLKQVERDSRENLRRNIIAGTLVMLGLLIGFVILAEFGAPVHWGPVP